MLFYSFLKFTWRQKPVFIRTKRVRRLACYPPRVGTTLWEHGSQEHQFLKGVGRWDAGLGGGVRHRPSGPRKRPKKTREQRAGSICPVNSCPCPWECSSFMNTDSWWRPKLVEMWRRSDNCLTLPHPLPGAVQTRGRTSLLVHQAKPYVCPFTCAMPVSALLSSLLQDKFAVPGFIA